MTPSQTLSKSESGSQPLPAGNGGIVYPELLTEEELIRYLRIPEVSKAADYGNVIDNLKRMHGLPCIHIGRQPLYPLEAVRQWVQEKVTREAGA